MPKLIFLFVNFHRDVGVENFTIPPIKTDHDMTKLLLRKYDLNK